MKILTVDRMRRIEIIVLDTGFGLIGILLCYLFLLSPLLSYLKNDPERTIIVALYFYSVIMVAIIFIIWNRVKEQLLKEEKESIK